MSLTLTRVAPADHTFTLQNADHTFTLETPTYTNYIQQLLADAVWYIDAANPAYSGGQTVPNLGTGGSALDATLGSTGGADSNDPAWLDWTGTNHVWLSGVAGNSLTATAPALTDNYLATKTDNTTTTGAAAPGAFTFSTLGAWKSIALRDSSNAVLTTVDLTTLTAATQTTFTGSGSEIWTLNRSTAGKKAVAVTGKTFLLGSDDFLSVADHPDLDMGASDSFTVLAVARMWSQGATYDALVVKKADVYSTAVLGYALGRNTVNASLVISDGSFRPESVKALGAVGALEVAVGVRSVVADTITAYAANAAAGTPVTDTTTTTLANAVTLQVGKSNLGYANMEFTAAAIWRRALTAAEITALTTYFQTRG